MAGKRVAIVQSSYIPWKGYFDLIRASDEFVLLDDVQFTARDWRSRNVIKTKDGLLWLTIPIRTKSRRAQSIREAEIADPRWAARHWQTIRASYARTPFFREYCDRFEPLYRDPGSDHLSTVNHAFIAAVCDAIGIRTKIAWSFDYEPGKGRNERLIDICRAAGATEYLSGPAARGYIDAAAFADAGISVRFVDYSGYPEYPQPYPPFAHQVSALDLLFCTGPRAVDYMKAL